ncbi:MAG: mechanosensitive ion channel family protein [Bacteroidales bacterium]
MPELEIPRLDPVVAAVIAVVLFAVATLAARAGRRLLRRSLTAQGVADPESREAVQTRARQLLRGLRLLAYGTASVTTALLLMWLLWPAQLKKLRRSPDDLLELLFDPGIRIALIIVAAYITVRAIHLWIEYLEYRFTSDAVGAAAQERKRRARTLAGTLASASSVAVAFGAGLTVLWQLKINVLPILTGAGIAGLAIGFGAQNLVRDVISGFFLILEDQVRVGDLAQIQAVTGLVEEINLRTIVLRDADGGVHVFPNGTITTLTNLSKDFAYAVVDLAVPLTENFTKVAEALEQIGGRMQADPVVGAAILEPLEILGLEAIGETSGTMRVRFKTLPLKQYAVARELRWRVVTQFAERGLKP